MFIGKFNKSVIVTYLGVLSTMIGCYLALFKQNILGSIICLMVSGICDMFDGKVARMCKNRTNEDLEYGIQIDSLTDMISFIAFPLVIFYGIILKYDINMNIILVASVSTVFTVCGITRLAYFNLQAYSEDGPVKYYSGLPVTTTAILFPFLYVFKYIINIEIFAYVYLVLIFIISFLFVFNFKLKKPKGKAFYITLPLAGIMFVLLLIYLKCRS